ncbi:autophagy-related protein 18h-like [Cynara cardunculus var. scolymus]|uniref:autophagy-related protein 18h-like n=1 Tax=Cynara cardunculus var. scolymus TaxID=59895 RepID=UPI000D63169D|nr:autophagy-related protein 18h-like [Cynara cardunculus var. scolymus]
MRRNQNNADNDKHDNANGLIPNSFRFISSYIKTVSSNVRSAGASVSGSVSGDSSDELRKDQVLWSCFDRLELSPSTIKNVLLLGYANGFQVLDVDDGSKFSELVSTRDDPVTFLQIQPMPEKSEGHEGFKMSHPLLLVVASEEARLSGLSYNERDESQLENSTYSSRAVRFYSLRSHSYVHVLRFRSTVYMVRCSPRIVAVGLASQIYCFDAHTLENKFSVLTYPISQLGGQGLSGINIGYGPMTVGPRWLAYASNNPLLTNTGRLSPQNLSPSPGVSPSTSPGSGSLMARYAMESSKQLATGLINLGDMSYRTLSKYCHELLPDGSSSPISSNSSRKAGRAVAHSTENANAGMVVIKDFVSRAVVSQFRAHTSPISALCFDPSGTLLVTASVHGNNINIFRILPSSQNESGSRNFDWNSAHVHLYKLHRGMTSAVIQDICFSNYSQWIAIVSSRGTCHIFLFSPFGGETGIQLQNSKSIGRTLSAFVSVPWWFTSSFMKDQSLSPPAPAAITLSVVSRIKNNFGWINTVSGAASGRVSAPPGVIAATFHSSVRHNAEPAVSNADILKHLLVYTPSGYVIQYELLPSIGREQGEYFLRVGTASQGQAQDEDLRVKVEPIQWWDVCRRTGWPEREEFIGGAASRGHNPAATVMTSSDDEDITVEKDSIKHQERSRWIPHAEVQMRSGRVPVWQKSKIYFFVMAPQLSEELNIGGEVDIETIPVHEVEVRQKDLLPVFDSSSVVHSGWTDGRVVAAGRYSASSSNNDSSDEKFPQDSTVFRGSSLAPANMQNMEQMDPRKSYPILASTVNNNDSVNRISSFARVDGVLTSALEEIMNSPSPGVAIAPSSESIVTSDASNPGSNRSDLSMNMVDEVPMHEDMLEFGHDFQQEYCKPSTEEEISPKLREKADVDGNNSRHQRSKSEEDGDSDSMLGGVFSFSEEC